MPNAHSHEAKSRLARWVLLSSFSLCVPAFVTGRTRILALVRVRELRPNRAEPSSRRLFVKDAIVARRR